MSDEKMLKTNVETTNSSPGEAASQKINIVEMPSRSVNIDFHIFSKRVSMHIFLNYNY